MLVLGSVGAWAIANKPQVGGDFAGGVVPSNLWTGSAATNSVSPITSNVLVPGAVSAVGVGANNQVTITFTVYNEQADPESGVLITDTLAPGVNLANASQLPDQSGENLAWSLGTIPGFDRASVSLTVDLPSRRRYPPARPRLPAPAPSALPASGRAEHTTHRSTYPAYRGSSPAVRADLFVYTAPRSSGRRLRDLVRRCPPCHGRRRN